MPPIGKWLDWALARVYVHLVLPFQQSHAPIPQTAWGASIGLFIGLTPTMGVQMYLAAMVWLVARYLLGLRFNLPIAVGMVWVTNPVTVLPIYYAFLITGDRLLVYLGYQGVPPTFAAFAAHMQMLDDASAGWLMHAVRGFWVLLADFGWPLLLGALVYAVPFAVLAYPVTSLAMLRYRRRLAAEQGLSYEEWKARTVRSE